jgi:guanylate kinase
MNEFPNKFTFSVSHTTRKPRVGEVDGINYHFIEKEQFQKMIEENQFIEFNKYSENYYGTSKNELLKWAKENKVKFLNLKFKLFIFDFNLY